MFLLLLLQFGGRPPGGPPYGGAPLPGPPGAPWSGTPYVLSAVIWALLFLFVVARFRSGVRTTGRRWLMGAFGLGLAHDVLLLFSSAISRPGLTWLMPRDSAFSFSAWWSYGLMVLLVGALLRYLDADLRWSGLYLKAAGVAMGLAFGVVLVSAATRERGPDTVGILASTAAGLPLLLVGAVLAMRRTQGVQRWLVLSGILVATLVGAVHVPAAFPPPKGARKPPELRRGSSMFVSPHTATVYSASLAAISVVLLGYVYIRTESSDVRMSLALLEDRVQERTADLEAALDELSTANAKLAEQSTLDELTGVRNRRFFDERLADEWSRAAREARPLGVALVDVDCFKEINDRYGHAKGDECLAAIAAQLQLRAQRPADVVARYGGDELALLLPGADEGGVRAVVEEARLAIRALDLDGPQLSVSAGAAACTPGEGLDPSDLMALADERLYSAKRAGRDRVLPAPSLTRASA